ncbi:8-oxo-dGTP pyrophosphatase MutT (NUDIX family) [Sphaerotilus hippei]|uniref:8-oxo-dGTP pyrophosphatase MutT (NUDIX family) n=1 Tax=Sphaerotilus hippei TaxID=744406 RepID=A0A318GWW5_9BURK|nr:CoA pyrophosphatase [Sphaerotilus hippei]PXW94190.1 8-oxo-dGTP pyrophosphatase MutT (NUDIX family) [Sphaerotilus hippei]
MSALPALDPAPAIFDPREVPIVSIGHELPVPSPDALTPQALRRRFMAPPDWQPEFTGDARPRPLPDRPRAAAAAAVLIPLVQRETGLQVLLTRRTAHLTHHAGQISFPGGRSEPGDADAIATALREAHEEVGLLPAGIEVIGRLPTYTTVTSFVVTPVVGLLAPPLRLDPDPNEVAEVFEVPLAFLMSPDQHRLHRWERDGHARRFLSMLWRPEAPAGEADYFIWGATAAMLRNLYRFVSA